jgi:Lactoylglutathione lyase and related lyases
MEPIEIRDTCTLLSVFDMPTSVRFYCDVLGFTIETRSPVYAVDNGVELFHWCMLKAGDARLMLNTAYEEDKRPAECPPQVNDPFGTWLFFSCPNIDEAYAHLQAAQIDCSPPQIAPYGFRTLSFRDPDGHGITLQWPEGASSTP